MEYAINCLSRRLGVPTKTMESRIERLSGGLESVVARVVLEKDEHIGSGWPVQFVIKELRGNQSREAEIYRTLWGQIASPPAVRVLGHDSACEVGYLYLEEALSVSGWPWKNVEFAARVCSAMAQLHSAGHQIRSLPDSWDYEAELRSSALETLKIAANARDRNERKFWRRLGDLRRIYEALPRVRRFLLGAGATFVHGDIHPGNVIVRDSEGPNSIVFIDWGRARIGSPWEDLASWLQSLGCWEPEARRRHDSLLSAYLLAATGDDRLTAERRTKYWFAGASNGLAGAIRYHLCVLSDRDCTEVAHRNSLQALAAWQRVITRAVAKLATIPAC